MIRKLWRLLFGGCDHHWKVIAKGEILYGPRNALAGHEYHLQCTKCGWIKLRKLLP